MARSSLLALLLFATASHADTLFITDVNVLPMDSPRVLQNQAILVEDGVIAAVGPAGSFSVPAGAERIAGEGSYVLPGLSDMHAHLYGYTDEASAGYAPEIAANQLLLYLATGVTLLRDMGGSPGHSTYAVALRSGSLPGPELHFASPILEGEDAVWEFSLKVTEPASVDKLIAGFARDGYCGVKVYHTLSAEVFDAVVASAAEYGLPVIGHVPFEVGIDRALAAGMRSIEHLRGYDFDGMSEEELAKDGGRSAERFLSMTRMTDARRAALIKETAARDVWNTPTLAIVRFLYDSAGRSALTDEPRFNRVHPALRLSVVNATALDERFSPESRGALRDVQPTQLEFLRRLNEAGAGILVGTDSVVPGYVPGFTVIDEIKVLASGGIPAFDVLRAATIGAAELLAVDEERGTIETGKQASFIMLAGNPLEDLDQLWSLRAVVHQGWYRTLADIEAMLDAQMESARWEPPGDD